MPAAAISIPATQRNSDKPTLPESSRIPEGVANMPVPIMRLKIKKAAETTPI